MQTNSAILPIQFQPKHISTLIRLGRSFDGGYLIDSRNLDSSTILIGMGLNDDWSFERDFYSRNPIPVYIYNSTVKDSRFIKNFLKSLIFKIHRSKKIISFLKICIDYHRFFKEDRYHVNKLVGLDGPPGYISLGSILQNLSLSENRRVFFKN